MIYVKRDPSLVPDHVLEVAKRAKDELELLPENQRNAFIKRKSHIWKSFKKYLFKMSHGKCWYSETKDPGAEFDVDHFRPKSEARRGADLVDTEGYAWLAFDWENFRLSAQLSNRLTKDEASAETVGKGSWFPLRIVSPKACWNNRCVRDEAPLLLDPVIKQDINYLDIDDTGLVVPAVFCLGEEATRVKRSAEIYGLNLPKIREARIEVMREVKTIYEIICETAADLAPLDDKAPMGAIEKQISLLKSKTRADAPFCKAARTQLHKLGCHEFLIDRSLDAV